MKEIIAFLRSLWSVRSIRAKLLRTLALVVLFRLLAHIPLVGVDVDRLQLLVQQNQFLGVLDIFSGGTLARFSLLAIGMSPYITASILLQITGLFIPQLKAMQKESEVTRAQLQQWTRLLTVPVAVMQSVSLLMLLRSQQLLTTQAPLNFMLIILSLVAGSVIVMWIGELLTKHGVGNGTSLIIFLGIVSQLPSSIAQGWALRSSLNPTVMIIVAVLSVVAVAAVVFFSEAVRRIPVQQVKRQRGSLVYGGSMSHIPVKVNQFGVMPIIFALPLLSLPTTVGTLVLNSQLPETLKAIARSAQIWFQPGHGVYNSLYFAFVFLFTFFSILVYFNPKDFSEEMKKSGTFVPGIRPGKPTVTFLTRTLLRLSLIGGLFLGLMALLPLWAQQLIGLNMIAIGGTGLLITVSVVLEIYQILQSQLVHEQYERYI